MKAAIKALFGTNRTEQAAYRLRYAIALLGRLGRPRWLPGPGLPPGGWRVLSDRAPVGFGYFDLQPFDAAEKRVLAQTFPASLAQQAAFPGPALGLFDLDGDSVFRPFARSRAWCWQQGSRLRWLDGGRGNLAAFNDEQDGRGLTRIVDTASGREHGRLASPLYCLSPDERSGLSLNFGRLERNRPGYGYGTVLDRHFRESCPAGDGIWRVDLLADRSELLLEYRAIAALPHAIPADQGTHYLNHLEFSPDGARFLFFQLSSSPARRDARAIVCAADGTSAMVLPELDRVSHFCWLDANHILLFCRHRKISSGYFRIDVRSGSAEPVPAMPRLDGHPRLVRANLAVTDIYPNARREQEVYLADLEAGSYRALAIFFAPMAFTGVARCDLHPRVSPSGRYVGVDTPHLGRRAMAILDLSSLS
jgi:hypothetical protein